MDVRERASVLKYSRSHYELTDDKNIDTIQKIKRKGRKLKNKDEKKCHIGPSKIIFVAEA